MNRDGYRSDWLTAWHEAAHAVIAILSGLAVAADNTTHLVINVASVGWL